MPDTTTGRRPTTTPHARAVVLTVDPLLACHLAALHTGVATALLTRLSEAGEGLRDSDALLLLPAHRRPDGVADRPATVVYIGTDLDDGQVWDRAARARASEVIVYPDDVDRLRTLLAERLDAAA